MQDSLDKIILEVEDGTKAPSGNIKTFVDTLSKLGDKTKTTVSGLTDLKNKFDNLGVSLKGSSLKDAVLKFNENNIKFKTTGGDVVTVIKKMKDETDKYTVSVRKASTETSKSTGIFGSFTKGISGALLKFGIIKSALSGLSNKTVDITRQATEYEEALNLFTVTMGSKAEEASKWVDKFSKALYIDDSGLMQYMGSLNSLIKGLGVATDKSYIMSKNLTQLVYDLASFKNLDIETSFRKIQSAMSGEIEPLRNVGVALSQNTLQELANSMGIEQRVATMNEASKAQLRYIQILQSTTEWQGDMGRTLISPANAIRVLQQQFALLGRAIGRMFIPFVMKAIPYVMALTQILTDLANRIATFFGYKIADIDYSSIKDMTIDISDGIEDIGDAATGTAKKLQTMLAPFDELNVVQKENEKAGKAGGVGGLGAGLDLPLPEYDALAGLTDQLSKNVDKAKENLEKFFDIAKKLAIVLGSLWAINKLITFSTYLGKLFGILPVGSTEFSGLALVLHNLAARFTKGKAATGTFTGGLKAMFPWLTKTKIGIAGVALSWLGSYDAAKKAADGTKEVDGQIKKFWVTTTAAAGTGALIAGPLGALAGAIGSVGVSLIGLGVGYSKLQKQLAEQEVFGTLSVSAETFKNMLYQTNLEIPSATESLVSLRDALESTNNSFENNINSVEQYMYRFGTLGQTITEEDGPKVLSAFEELFANANQIIDKGTQYSLELWTNSMMNMTGVTVDEQKNILDNITENGEFQKSAIDNAQNDIKTIWSKAMSERRNLTEEEYNKIKELLGIIETYTSNSVSAAQTKLIAMKNKFNDKNFELDKDSYAEFIKARDEYEKEQEESALAHYNTLLNDAERNYTLTLDRLRSQGVEEEEAIKQAELQKQIAYQAAYDSYTDQQKKYKDESERVTNEVFDGLRKKYSEIKDENEKGAKDQKEIIEGIFNKFNIDYNPLRNTYSEAGRTAADSYVSSFEKYVKGKSVKFKITTDANGNAVTTTYATGGFPKTGEFFMAREDGPEMVGRIGNKTAVANNDQITTSITNALVTALSGMNLGGNKGTTVVNIGGRKVYEGVGDYIDSENDRYGTNYVRV